MKYWLQISQSKAATQEFIEQNKIIANSQKKTLEGQQPGGLAK